MTDIDYDELDRAVNSLANDETSSVPDVVKPANAINMPQRPITDSQPTVAPSIVSQRSRGRFMDVVHPSSNMRSTTSIPVPERDTSRISPTTTPYSTPNTPVLNNSISPMSFANNTQTPQKQDEDADINKISDDISRELGQTPPAQDSPFITDAKVEKRPLGAFSETPNTSETVQPTMSPYIQENNREQEETAGLGTPMPAELDTDLLSIESDSAEQTEPADIANLSVETPSTTTPAPVVSVPAQPLATASITQQYKEQPSTGDQNTGAIYDTDSYHKALVQPVKKKSGWLWILWIVLLLIVGAAAGAAVYFFVLPSL